MKKFWWIVSIIIHTTGWDGSPDSDSYPVKEKESFKFFGSNDQINYEDICGELSISLVSKYKNKQKTLDFVWCLGENGEQELILAEELREYLKVKLVL